PGRGGPCAKLGFLGLRTPAAAPGQLRPAPAPPPVAASIPGLYPRHCGRRLVRVAAEDLPVDAPARRETQPRADAGRSAADPGHGCGVWRLYRMDSRSEAQRGADHSATPAVGGNVAERLESNGRVRSR